MRKLPMVLIVAVFACLAQSEQAIAQQESGSAVVPAGSSTYRLVLTVAEPPAPKDSIQATVSTAQVTTTLILPNGHRITGENAESEGFGWSQGFDGPAPLGSEDYGQSVNITFRKRAPAGRYTLEFAFQQRREPARVQAHFTSRMSDYLALVRAAPGAQVSKAVPVSPSATVTFDLPKDEEEVMFDVVVPDASTDVVLVLPDGRKLRRSDAKNADVNWTVVTNPKKSFFDELYLPLDGTHQLVWFKRAAKGRYEIQATPKTAANGEMRVAVVPMNGFGEAWAAKFKRMELETGEVSSSGGVQIRPQHLPYECFVGDKLDFQIELVGAVGPETPQFEVREERKAWSGGVLEVEKYAESDPVEVLPVRLTEVSPGTYRGTVIPRKPGLVRITVRAMGKNASGQNFATETFLTNTGMKVNPVAARFLGFTAKPIAAEGGSKFDRLEVAADLDVLMPGDYAMVIVITNKRGDGVVQPQGRGHATLQMGRQTLTASIPSSEIWRNEADGPLDVSIWGISRSGDANYYFLQVPTEKPKLQTPAYRHDQWGPGQVYGEDHVTVRGIAPAASGKFRFAEVEWEVTTPGLLCNWNSYLRGVYRPPYTSDNPQPSLDAAQTAKLPAGKTKVSFIFDGAAIHRFGKQDWTLWAGLNCGDTEYVISRNPPFSWLLTPNQKIDLNPDEYAPAHGSLVLHVEPIALRLSPGDAGNTALWVKEKKDVQFAVTDVPKGVDASLSAVHVSQTSVGSGLRITTSPEAKPGRYFLTLSATSGGEVVRTQVVLDVVAK